MAHSSTENHVLRKQLLANGYRPLPLIDKGIRITGWTRAEINQEWLNQFTRVGKYRNTGIRCDDLIAFDIDVLDEDLANEIEDYIESTCGPTDLCRVGKWPKRLLLYRASRPLERSARTGKYGGHQVELLATHGRQFAAFGIHPDTREEYEWLDGHSPLTTPYADLPELSAEGAEQCLNSLDELLAATGLEKTSPGGRRGAEAVNSYDLTDGVEVMLSDSSVVTWGGLKTTLDSAGVFGNLKRENGEWGDSNGVHFYIAAGVGEPCIHDFARDTTHWDKPATDQLAAVLPPPPAGVSMFTPDPLEELIRDYVLLADKTVRPVDQPEMSFSIDGFGLINAHKTIPAPTTRNPGATTPAVAAWVRDPATLRADKAALRPDYPDDVIVHDGKLRIFNTYNPPALPGEGGSLEAFHDFVAHLVPDERERAIFLDWHALKVARPDLRLHGLILVTPTFGTGRGTWLQIVERLLGAHYVNEISFKNLVGEGGQSDFNEYFANSLLIAVSEALDSTDSGKWRTRHLAYEALKEVCDPAPQTRYVKRKYGKNSFEHVYASILIASNHGDMLAIEVGDRRLVVLSNGDTPLVDAEGDLYDRIHDWARDPANIGALHRWFVERAATAQYDPYGRPPMTPAKQRMVELSRNDVDVLFDMFVEQAKGDVCTHYQWRAFAYKMRASVDLDLPDVAVFDRALVAVLANKGCRFNNIPACGIKVEKRVIRPWIIRRQDAWKGSTLWDDVRREVAKNGAAGGNVANIAGKDTGE